MNPGRKQYVPLNPSAMSSFSVRPFTRAHIARPFAFVPAPEMKQNVASGRVVLREARSETRLAAR